MKITIKESDMRAREFHQVLSMATGATLGEVDQRTRFLREIGVLQTGPRGHGAPNITPLEAACMLMVMVSRRAADSETVFVRANSLEAISRKAGGRDFLNGAKLGGVLASIISTPDNWTDGLAVDRVEVEENGEFAWLRMSGLDILFTSNTAVRDWVTQNPDAYSRQFDSSARRCFVIGGGLLHQIALELSERDEPAKYAKA
ncbi:hypothetical protein [Oricola sp.]|uniref:hypothetical protein n=1 Tax=Oricola sp. TaxID=1979950 RepID=UPI0025FC3226|nr:hypothetical protein [Oricola sp.]MCI5078241.1 hypothetical protein [Oricola sp.]